MKFDPREHALDGMVNMLALHKARITDLEEEQKKLHEEIYYLKRVIEGIHRVTLMN